MVDKSTLFAFFSAGILACGCAVESVEGFGRGGIVSIESKPIVYDFSKDGKYLWLSETNCYDLSGHKVKTCIIEGSSGPLPRLQWKKRVLGSAWNYAFSGLSAGNGFDIITMRRLITQLATDNDFAKQKRDWGCSTVRWTFSSKSLPIFTAMLRGGAWPDHADILAWGTLPDAEDAEVPFRAVMVPKELARSLGWNCTLSESMQHIASSSFVCSIDNPRLRFSDISIDYMDNRLSVSNEVFVTQGDLRRLVNDDGLMFNDLGGPGLFLNENYFAFAGTNGGRMKLTARDYLFVYGFREKRVVKAFRSHLRFFDEGYHINDVDVALSADEKYLAIRYDGVITIYPFRTDSCVKTRE